MSIALVAGGFLGGYLRRAYAACAGSAGTYVCSGALSTTQSLSGSPLSVSTASGFSINPSGNAFTLTGSGGLTFFDRYSSTITGSKGVAATNSGSGALSISTSGAVTGTGAWYTSSAAISATNSGSGGLSITSTGALATSQGGSGGGVILATNSGGALSIKTYGAVTGGVFSPGIVANNNAGGTNLTITTSGPVFSTGWGQSQSNSSIAATNSGSGALSITATGAITAHAFYGMGIVTTNNSTSTNLTITAADITSAWSGIVATNSGSGAMSITDTGTITSRNAGIQVTNNASAGGLTISAATVTAGTSTLRATYGSYSGASSLVAGVSNATGISAVNNGTGALSITSTGAVTGGSSGIGINAQNSGTSTDPGLTIHAANVYGGIGGIQATNSRGYLSIITTGTVSGTGTNATGISATNNSTASNLIISASGTVTGQGTGAGISATNSGGGYLSISTTGAVTGGASAAGINASNNSTNTGSTSLVSVSNGATVTGATAGIAVSSSTGRNAIITLGNNATVNGSAGVGISAANTSTTASADTVTIGNGTIVSGTTAGISMSSPTAMSTATITNNGTIENASALSTSTAIASTGNGSVAVNDNGTIIGTVALGAGNDSFTENSNNSWHTAGGTNDFGAGANTIDNNGTIYAAESGASAPVTTVFQATGGTLTFNNNAAGTLTMQNGVVGDVTVIGNSGQTNGTFVSNGGALKIDTRLGGDGSPTDLLRVNGNVTLGTAPTKLYVNNVGGSGGTTTTGIKVVDVIGGTSAAGAFTLGAPVVAGIHQYSLALNAADQDWYLQSSSYSPTVLAAEVLPQLLLKMNALPDFLKRTGYRYFADGVQPVASAADHHTMTEQADPAQQPGPLWVALERTSGREQPQSSTAGARFDPTLWRLRLGADGLLHENRDGDRIFAGLMAHYGQGSADVSSSSGNASLSATGYGLGATVSWVGTNSVYLDAQAQASRFSTDLKSPGFAPLAEGRKGTGYAVSLEGGRRLAISEDWHITPQAQLIYSKVRFDSFTDPYGATISLDKGDSLKLRGGLTFEQRSGFYGLVNIYREFKDGTRVDASGTPFTSTLDKWTGEVGAGGVHRWNNGKYALHGDLRVATGLSNFGRSRELSGWVGFETRF